MNIQQELCAWYLRSHRDLPFRRSRDPYAIWVSEVMAQQTRIESMLPYYQRWMAKWPDVASLAKAPLEEVLHLWQGLGYYNRARKLHEGAKVVCQQFHGQLPVDVQQLRTIPGIGAYTAGAIASIAYGQRTPAVDGNVLRVTSRLCQIEEEITRKSTVDNVSRQVWTWMEGSDPAVFTQALMELGALVCTPKNPQCLLCPLRSACRCAQDGTWADYPVKKKAKPPQRRQLYTYWIENDRRQILLSQDWSDGLMKGLYRLPQTEIALRQTPQLSYQGHRRHVFSHRVWEMECYRGRLQSIALEDCFWVNKEELAHLPLVSAHRKWLMEAGGMEKSDAETEKIRYDIDKDQEE